MLEYLRYRWERFKNWRALRADRRGRPHGDLSDDATKGESSNFAKGGYFTK